MKKSVIIHILIIAVIVFLFIFYYNKSENVEIKDKIDDPNSNINSSSEIIPEVDELGTICEEDSDCILINENKKLGCSICGDCGTIDYSMKEFIAVNRESFEKYNNNWIESNCEDDFYECKIDNFKDFDKCEPYLRCPDCEPNIINKEIKAKCVSNICTKV
ncbi:MAG: hypothetical protein Q7S27_00510 [Nanoarchaeota archaeon]|nr:hypothetical protein [Nanoarchaeota archaeon]